MKILKITLCLALSLAMVFSVCGCLDSEPTKETNSNTETMVEEVKEQIFGLNETAVFDTLKITATEIKESKGKSFFEAEEGKVFVGINFTVENISDEEQTVSSLLLFDGYVDDISCDYSFSAGVAFDSKTVDGTIAPGKKAVGYYTIEAPENWAKIELDVKADWLSSTKARFEFKK